MKIMKVLGVVVGVHVFALILIFANPGCSSTSKPAPAPVDTVAKSDSAPAISVPGAPPADSSTYAPVAAAPIMFDPNAPALAGGGGGSGGIRFSPTRPGTAAATTLVAEPVANVTPATTYTVTSGDSLWSIAHKKGITVAELAAANNLGSNVVLKPGQKLLIPGKSASHAAAAATATMPATAAAAKSAPAAKTPADSVKHTVKNGETLSGIAKTYGVKSGDIALANNITDPARTIRPGMVLVIPGWKAAGSKNAGATAKPAPAAEEKAPASTPPQIPVIGPGSTPTEIPVIPVEGGAAPTTKP